MRFLIKVSIPVEAGNKLVREGTLGERMGRILSELKPEAAYFTTDGGMRTGFIVADIKDPHQMPSIAEPWFLALGAGVEFHPAMTPEDLQKAGPDLARAGKTYG